MNWCLGKYCGELTFLNISRVRSTPQSLKILTQHCTKLKVGLIRILYPASSECVFFFVCVDFDYSGLSQCG